MVKGGRPSAFNRLMFVLLRPRKQWLWHPESPGMKVLVVRTWIGRLLKPDDFATINEDRYEDSPLLPPLHEPWSP
jgi:hypothetical protein